MIESKLPHVGTTIFTTMSALANDCNAINLSQGFPNFPVDENLIDLIKKYYSDGFNQYAPMQGVMSLRNQISHQLNKKYSVNINPESEITVTAGATQAIYTAITAVIKEGDEVIYFSPAYDCYEPAIQLNKGVAIEIPLNNQFEIDWEVVKSKITRQTKLIIINTPHNPTGSILKKEDLLTLEKIITENENLYLLSDEVYEHIIFDNRIHESALKYEDLRNKTFAVFSFGKSLHATGWKLGYCVAPPYLTNEFRKVHQFNVFSCNTPTQYAIADYIKLFSPFEGISKMYEEKRNLFLDLIKNSRFEAIPCKGTYFQLLSYKNISDENDIEYAKRLTKEQKIASIPISVFYKEKIDNKILRFCFAKDNETLEKAAKLLCQI